VSARAAENRPGAPGSDELGARLLPTCGQLSGHRTANDTLCAVPYELLTHASGKRACLFSSISEDEKLAITARGGAKASRLVRNPTAVNPSLRTMAAIQAFLEETAGRLDRGEISERGAHARAQLADKAIRAHSENIGDRLLELEELMATRARAASSPVVRVLR
jgi:hypothetical protein